MIYSQLEFIELILNLLSYFKQKFYDISVTKSFLTINFRLEPKFIY